MSEQNKPIALLGELYYTWSGKQATEIVPLPESGSYRHYFRILGEDKPLWAFTIRITGRTSFYLSQPAFDENRQPGTGNVLRGS